MEYHVFLTPKGDCKGLYVTNETSSGFEVHELGGGASSIAFDYRIVARRKGYEKIRMADLGRIQHGAIVKSGNSTRASALRSPRIAKAPADTARAPHAAHGKAQARAVKLPAHAAK